MFRNSIIHEIFFEFLQPLSEFNRSWSSSFFVLDFLLASVLCFQHVNLTRLRDGDPSHTGSPRSCLSTLSLDTVEDVMGVEVDELEEELVDKPGTTMGTKFSVLHCIGVQFQMRCGF